mmetsp:Transcript_19025/g.27769  ORF Transcript_19025/g.27769 Transcript_19025/m.27769 type:complete len:226 (-) Transcript_19025:488-1165(-)
MFLRHIKNVVYVLGPPLKDIPQIFGTSIGFLLLRRRTCWFRQECIPLISPVTDISDDEILTWSDIYFVTDLPIVNRVVIEFTSKHRVSRIRYPTSVAAHRLASHGGTHRRPNSISSQNDIALHGLSTLHNCPHTIPAGVLLVTDNTIAILNHSFGQAVKINLLQIRTLNNPGIRHVPVLCGGFQIKLCVPLITNSVFDTILLIASEGEFRHYFVINVDIHILQYL